MKKYYKAEFMKAAGINNRQRLSQILKGFNRAGTITPPLLKENVDYKKTKCECCGSATIIFYEAALRKIKP